jgi:hypothetical protein
VRRPAVFNQIVPVAVHHITRLFESVHTMHDRALGILNADRPYCLYLRGFSAGGRRFAGSDPRHQTLVQAPTDQRMRQYMADHLDDIVPIVAAFNVLDVYGLAEDRHRREVPATLRLLSHNWKRTIQALVDGAASVVLFRGPFDADTEGVQFELLTIRQFEQHRRCIFVLDTERTDVRSAGFDVHSAFGWPMAYPDWDELAEPADFIRSLRALASDGHRRVKTAPPLEFPACYVVDKDLPGLEVAAARQAGTDYPYIIPPAMRTNLDALQREYPPLLERWAALEQRWKAGRSPTTDDLQAAMYTALFCFVVATTLEHYEPMSRSLAIVGLAHRLITRSPDVERVCLEGAVAFAHRAGLDDLAQHLRNGLS